MARRKDDPSLQAAKGYPGRRKKQTDAAINAAAAAAEAEAPGVSTFAIPSVLRNAPAYYRRAIEMWKAQADTLRSGGRRRPGYRGALTRYCIWSQIYESAADQLRRDCPKGDFVIDWTPVGGAPRKIPHPSLKIMANAEPILRGIEDDFGFTPRSDSALLRVETFNNAQRQGHLFDDPRQTRDSSPQAEASDPTDLMTSTDSQPPTIN
jgi:phage terminase small subunit